MAFVSYAQNAEDVMLFRALKHLQQGCYIDIGANHPTEDSVTKAFYSRGWTGVNVEPVSYWFQQLTQDRPKDNNLQLAISDSTHPLAFYEVAESGLSTLDAARAEACRAEGLTVLQNTVNVWTLARLFEHAAQPQTHFLKIDVEGAETQVIRSGDWGRHRPWVVLVESTQPNTNISEHDAWEPILLNHGYRFVWFDGINRFYLAEEHSHLASAFQHPINVLDHYVTYREVRLIESRCQLILDMQARHDDFQTELGNAKHAIASAKQAHDNAVSALNVANVNNELVAFYQRDPLIRRAIRLRRVPGGLKRRLARFVQHLLLRGLPIMDRHPRCKTALVAYLNRHPQWVNKLRALSGRALPTMSKPANTLAETLAQQPPAVQDILTQLKQNNV